MNVWIDSSSIKVKEIIIDLLSRSFSQEHMSIRLVKAIELTESESSAAMPSNKIPMIDCLFWCWITKLYDEEKSIPTFIFGRFYIDKNILTWGYKAMQYKSFAKKTYKRGWIDRIDIRERRI